MAHTDVIPATDKGFDDFQSNLITLCTTNQVAWGIVLTLLSALTPFQTAWAAAYLACKNKRNATTAQRVAKNTAKKALIAKLRPFIQSQIQYNLTMTDSQKVLCGVTPRNPHHTPSPAPSSVPQIVALPMVGHVLKISFRQQPDAEGTSRRGKPDGVTKCKIVYMVAPDPQTPSPSQCGIVLYCGRSPRKISFDVGIMGQHFYCYACWVNATGEEGDWSELHSAIIP